MTDQRTHIVVIGGGYAGTLAANHLRLRADVEITLVNPRPVFVERIRLHQLAAGSGTAAVDYGTPARRGHPAGRRQRRADQQRRPPDRAGFFLRVGLRLPDLRGRQHRRGAGGGARRSRIRLSRSLNSSMPNDCVTHWTSCIPTHPSSCRRRLDRHRNGIRAGRAGPAVTLVCGGVLGPSLSRPGRRSVAKWLRRLGVDVLETAVVREVRPDAVVLADGAAAAQRTDGVDGGLRRAGAGRPQRAAHRRAGPVAHR